MAANLSSSKVKFPGLMKSCTDHTTDTHHQYPFNSSTLHLLHAIYIAAAAPAPFGRCLGQRPDDAELGREAARLRDRHEQAEEEELQLLAGVAQQVPLPRQEDRRHLAGRLSRHFRHLQPQLLVLLPLARGPK